MARGTLVNTVVLKRKGGLGEELMKGLFFGAMRFGCFIGLEFDLT